MHVSVIVPTYNSTASLQELIACLKTSVYQTFDLIVVDDGSDSPYEFCEKLSVPHQVLRLNTRQGPAHARNLGAARAQGEILLFIDSDILIYPETIGDVVHAFTDSQRQVVNGMIDSRLPSSDFASNFYNLRLCYNYSALPENIQTIYSSLFANKRETFKKAGGFSVQFDRPTVEDSELGYRLHEKGVGIYLDRKIKFIHKKNMSLAHLLKNDWIKSIAKAELLLRQVGLKNAAQKNVLYSTPKSHLFSIPFAFLTLSALSLGAFDNQFLYLALGSSLVFAFLNWGYLRFFYSEKGFVFALQSFLFLFIDLTVAGVGVLVGMVRVFKMGDAQNIRSLERTP